MVLKVYKYFACCYKALKKFNVFLLLMLILTGDNNDMDVLYVHGRGEHHEEQSASQNVTTCTA